MARRDITGLVWLCLVLVFSSGSPVRAAEPPPSLEEAFKAVLSHITKEDVAETLKRIGKPRLPMSLENIKKEYEGQQLEFLLAVRNGRAETVKRVMGGLDFTAEGDRASARADAWGDWYELSGRSDWRWKKQAPAQIYDINFASEFILEAYLQAGISDDSGVWVELRPLLEKFVVNFFAIRAVIGAEESNVLKDILRHRRVDPDAPLVAYRFGKSSTAREPSVCYMAASGALHDEILQIFLAEGANPDVQCLDEWTPLSLAIQEGNLSKVRMLLHQNAAPNAKSHGFTPLELVEASYNDEFVKRELNRLLVEHGAVR